MRVFLGCSNNIRKDWVNVDLFPVSKEVVQDDARKLSKFKPASVETIESLHLLEHISHKDVPAMFVRWLEVLVPGGKVVVECPDILAISKEFVAWHEAGRVWTKEASWRFARKDQSQLSHRSWHTLFGGTHSHEGQKNGSWWDSFRLVQELEVAGFVKVRSEPPVDSIPQWGPSIRVVAEKKR